MKIRVLFFLLVASVGWLHAEAASCPDFLSRFFPRPDVAATARFADWLHFEFGKPGHPDRIVMREKTGWLGLGRPKETLLYTGRITRIPAVRGCRVPKAVSARVTSYKHQPDPDYPWGTFTITVEDGVFVFSLLAPYSGLGMFNYRGHSTTTVFFIPQEKPWKYISSAGVVGVGSYADIDEDRTEYDSPYALIVLREGEEDGGMTGDELRKKLQYLMPVDEGYEWEVPQERIETWLVKAVRPPADDFSDAKFYRFGGRALWVGEGDYAQARVTVDGGTLVLTPEYDSDTIRIGDPVSRPPVEVDLSELD